MLVLFLYVVYLVLNEFSISRIEKMPHFGEQSTVTREGGRCEVHYHINERALQKIERIVLSHQ